MIMAHRLPRVAALAAALAVVLGLLGGCGSEPEQAAQQDRDPLARERAQDWAASVDAADWLACVRAQEAALLWAERVGASALAGAEAAAARAAAPRARPKAVAKSAGTPRPKATAAAPTRGGAGIDAVRAQFDAFARDWVGTISRNLRHTAADMALQREGGDAVVARFMEVDHGSLEMQVKPSASGGAVCPFVGVLRYKEHHYESRAASEAEARRGPFTRVKTQRVTEIFRYVAGRWTN